LEKKYKKMKNYKNKLGLAFCLSLLILVAKAQTITIEGGGNLFISNVGTLLSDGNLTIEGTGILENYGVIEVKGNFNYNSPVVSPFSGTLRLNGTSLQTIGGTNVYNINNIDFNNPAGFLLNKSLHAFREINFTAGIVNAPSISNPLKFSSAAYIGASPSNTKHVNGYVHRDGTNSFTFPVGNGSVYQPVGLTTTANSYGVLAKYNSGNGGTGSTSSELDSYNTSEYWDIIPYEFSPSFPATLTGQVTIFWDDETSTTPLSERKVAHKSGTIMKNEGGNITDGSTLANGSVTSSMINTWSPFMLGFKALGGPLPVTLISFKGKATEKGNELEWKIASEKNFSHYEVERSVDAKTFEIIGKVNGAGNTKEKLVYNFIDSPLTPGGGTLSENSSPLIFSQPNTNAIQSTPPLGVGGLFYRLSLIDQDGTKNHSNIIFIDRKSTDFNITNVFPNPAINSLTVSYNSGKISNADLTIVDFSGKLIYENKINGEFGSNSKEIDVKNWPAGAYLLKISDGQTSTIKKIIKQ
jgi:hypothetical protein